MLIGKKRFFVRFFTFESYFATCILLRLYAKEGGTMPAVSVIIPIYQAKKYLEASVASMQRQLLRDIEIILVDDGSTDGSGDICEAIARRDNRVRVIHQPNRGLGPARNAGLDAAKGEYLYFCDADDLMEPDLLSDNYSLAKETQADVVVFGAFFETVTPEGKTILESTTVPKLSGAYTREALWRILPDQGVLTMIWTRLFRREFLVENGIRSPSWIVNEDAHVVYDVYAAPFRAIAFNQKAYYHYIRRSESLSHKYRPQYAEDMYAGMVYAEDILRREKGDFPWMRGFISRQYMISITMVMNNMAESPELSFAQKTGILKDYCRRERTTAALKAGTLGDMRQKSLQILFLLLRAGMYATAMWLGTVKKRRANKKRV